MPGPLIDLSRWQDLTPADRDAVRRLRLGVVQLEYAGPIERAIAACEADAVDVAGLAIRSGTQLAGFVVLKRRAQAPAWAAPGAAVVSALRIDERHQGQGLGTAALIALAAWVGTHWPECHALTLSVDEENAAGLRAYARAGFRDHGLRVEGRIGPVRYLTRGLA